MFRSFSKQQAIALTLIRVIVGIVFMMHGWQKFAQMGHSGVAGYFAHSGIPMASLSAWIVMLLELVGGFLFAIGFLTRLVAAGFAFEMLVAIVTMHLKNGFFLPKGYEFALTLMVVSIGFAIAGAGSPSVDGAIAAGRGDV